MGSKKILTVDDQENVRKVLEATLSEAGYEVIAATNGADGIEAAKKNVPDLIILDMMLPDINGGEAAKALGADSVTKDIPVLFLTGMVAKEDNLKIQSDGRSYPAIAKPVDTTEVLSEVKKILG